MKVYVNLSEEQHTYLSDYVRKGVHSARSIRRARALLLLAKAIPQKHVALALGCSAQTITDLIARYREEKGDVQKTLLERPRPGQPPIITPEIEAHITALACCQSPEGTSGWTLRMMAGRMVELGYVEHLSHETVRGVLKKVNSSPGSIATGASAR